MKSEEHVGADVLVCLAERSSAAVHGQERLCHMGWLQHAVALLVSVAQEIFDETAYQRFLRRTQSQTCAESYARFRKEHDALKARRARCC